MAGEWIKVERSTPDKPEVLRIARELCIDRDAVFGKLMLVWMWFDVNSYNGVVDGAVDADVDALARLNGFAAQMRAVNWLTDSFISLSGHGLSIPNFARHNGETAKKRALSNRRQSKWRNAHVDGGVDGVSVTGASTREEKRREEIKTKPKSAFALPAWVPSADWEAFVDSRNKLRKPMTDHARSLVLRELEKLKDAGHDPRTVLEQSVRRGWLDVFPLKDHPARPVGEVI